MPLNYTLENSILEDIQIIKDSIYIVENFGHPSIIHILWIS